MALNGVFLCGIVYALTSCGGGEDRSTQLTQLEAALAQAQAQDRADRAALLQAEASGANKTTIVELQDKLASDDHEVQTIDTEISGFGSYKGTGPDASGGFQ